MAITLTESAKLTQDTLRRGVIETFANLSPVLDRLPLMHVEGNAYAYNKEAALPGVAWRAVNTSYTESTGTVNQESERLYILGGVADVDNFIVQTRSNLNDQRAVQTRMKVKALVREFQDAFINGNNDPDDGDENMIDGLAVRLTGNQVLAGGTNGIPVIGSSVSDQHAFLDALDELISRVDGQPSALYMNASILSKIKSSARRLGFHAQTRDEFGRLVDTYNGIPLLDIGNDPAGNPILPQTEDQGTAVGTTSSIYAVRFGEGEEDGGVTGLTNGGVMVENLGKLESAPAWRTRIEFYVGLALFSGKGAARLTGVLNS